MTDSDTQNDTQEPAVNWLYLLPAVVMCGGLIYALQEGLWLMVNWWENKPEYNHGYLIAFVAAYLLLLCAERFKQVETHRAWSGLLVVAFGLILLLLGEMSSVYTIIQYGFLVTLTGMIITAIGWKATLVIWTPIAYLFFMICRLSCSYCHRSLVSPFCVWLASAYFSKAM